MAVLVDTSVWVAHFRERNLHLQDLLERDDVLIHSIVLGEIACGTPPDRAAALAALRELRPAMAASIEETMLMIEHHRLYGQGCGIADMLLLAATLMTPGATLWTLDKRLAAHALALGAAYQPPMH